MKHMNYHVLFSPGKMQGIYSCVAFLFHFIFKISGCSYFERDMNLDDILVLDTESIDKGYTTLANCSRFCHEDDLCRTFTFQQTTGRCQLFLKTFLEPERKIEEDHSRTFRKINDDIVCEIPAFITKGRLLSIDGQQEGSRACFNCDVNHFPNVAFGECSAGSWIGLNNPCVYKGTPRYNIPLEGRIKPGVCVVMLLQPPTWSYRPALRLQNDIDIGFEASFRFNTEIITRNSHIGGNWGTEERDTHFWPLVVNQIFNITLCIEEDLLRVFVDTVELFTFNHRLPISDINQLEIREEFYARSVAFTE